MLKKLSAGDAEKYIEYGYRLATDRARSGYPLYSDGIKTKRAFHDAVVGLASGERSELLLFERDGAPRGLFGYFYLPDDKYIQTTLLCAEDPAAALRELIDYLCERFRGYELNIGVPSENAAARGFLIDIGFTCIENDYHCVLLFESYTPVFESYRARIVSTGNFSDFAALHDGEQMYWTTDRISKSLSDWLIFVYYGEDGKPVGAIYARDNSYPEIFGVDFANGFDRKVYGALLTKLLNFFKATGAIAMTYFVEAKERAAALSAGFSEVGEYFCFSTTL